jgi:hypothetical protein
MSKLNSNFSLLHYQQSYLNVSQLPLVRPCQPCYFFSILLRNYLSHGLTDVGFR